MADSDDEFQDALEDAPGLTTEEQSELEDLSEMEMESQTVKALPSGVDREILADNLRRGIDKFFSNQFKDSENTFSVYRDSDPLHALGYGVLAFLRAAMSFADDDMAEAAKRLKHAQGLAYARLKAAGKVGGNSFSRMFSKTKLDYSPDELDALVIMAESNLLASILLFFQESIAAYVKGSLGMRKGYKLYEQAEKVLKQAPADKYDDNTRGGVLFGIGNVNMILSMLPEKILKIVSFMGFPSDQATGLKMLSDCLNSDNFRTPLASLALLTYHAILPGFFSTHDADVHIREAEGVLELMLAKYPTSALHLLCNGRLDRVKRDLPASIVSFEKAEKAQSAFPQLHHLCWYELATSYMCSLQFDKALPLFEQLAEQSSWSPAFYAYSQAVCLLHLGEEAKANALLAKVTSLVTRKFGGKTISVEQFVLRKAKTYVAKNKPMPLPHLEIAYLWNGMVQLDKATLNKALSEVDEFLAAQSGSDANSLGVALLVKAVALRELGQLDESAKVFATLQSNEARIDEEKWVVPFSYYERANLVFAASGDLKEYDRLMAKARSFNYDFNFEVRLQFRIHLSNVSMKGRR